jgi:hypothetical protein
MGAHLAALRARPARARPGSYAWPKMRLRAERAFAQGAPLASVQARILTATYTNAEPPSPRTIQRWHHQRRWALPPPRATTWAP